MQTGAEYIVWTYLVGKIGKQDWREIVSFPDMRYRYKRYKNFNLRKGYCSDIVGWTYRHRTLVQAVSWCCCNQKAEGTRYFWNSVSRFPILAVCISHLMAEKVSKSSVHACTGMWISNNTSWTRDILTLAASRPLYWTCKNSSSLPSSRILATHIVRWAFRFLQSFPFLHTSLSSIFRLRYTFPVEISWY